MARKRNKSKAQRKKVAKKRKAQSMTAQEPVKIPEPKVHQPPVDEMGRPHTVICVNNECQHKADIWASKEASWLGVLATCPVCGGDMLTDRSSINIVIKARGAGAHSGTIGDRKKRMMLERSEKLKKKQWDNVQPMSVPEGRSIRNPTEGGPLDPSGPFVAKKGDSTVFLPGGGSYEKKGNKGKKPKT